MSTATFLEDYGVATEGECVSFLTSVSKVYIIINGTVFDLLLPAPLSHGTNLRELCVLKGTVA